MATANETRVNHGVEVRYSIGTKGRGLFSTRAFKEGEVLLEENPIVSCQFAWNTAYGYAACDFCLKPLETAQENACRLTANPNVVLPNPECDETVKEAHVICPHCATSYCCSTCKENAWNQYHKTLCTGTFGTSPDHPLEKLNEAWKVMHYPPETASIMLLVRILASVIQCNEQDLFKSQLMQLCHRTVNEEDDIAHKLLGKQFKGQLEKLRDLTMKAIGRPEISEFLTPEGFRSLFALIGRNGQGVGTSSFSVWVTNLERKGEMTKVESLIDSVYEAMEAESGDFLNVEGSALYSVQSACNHSCRPNAEPTFRRSNHMLSLVALQDIEENQEIYISYLDECALSRSRHSRRKLLQENYLFNCQCSKCMEEADQEDVTSDDEEEMDED